MDDSVRLGAMQSSLRKSAQRGQRTQHDEANREEPCSLLVYSGQGDEDDNFVSFVATRAHCEDRMSCALALGSSDEFKHWLSQYVQILTKLGSGSQLRTLTDILLGPIDDPNNVPDHSPDPDHQGWNCWWLNDAPAILGLDRKTLVQSIVIPIMSKNRALQRITNEIAVEIASI
jgi:protein HIRA/HIR1